MERKTGKGHLWVHITLIIIAVSWGFNNTLMKISFTFISAQQFGGLRMLLVFPFMLYFAFFSRSRVRFESRDIWRIALIGLFGMSLFQVLFLRGLDETSAPLGGILMATMPIQVVILSLIFRLESIRWRSITGVLLTLLGLSIIVLSQSSSGGETTIRGILFVVFAELGFAINTTFLRPYMKKYPPIQVTGLAMSVSVIVYMFGYYRDMRALLDTGIPWQVWPMVMYSGFIAFLLANVLWNLSVRKIGSTQVSVYGNLPTVFVLLFSALMFHQILTGWQLLGSSIILSGVILVQFRKVSGRAEADLHAIAD